MPKRIYRIRKNRFRQWRLLFVCIVVGWSMMSGAAAQGNQTNKVRSMILMIGDGMGSAHIKMAGDAAGKPLVMESLPVKGRIKTDAANGEITDSAAAGTALACGMKTDIGVIGLSPDGEKLKSIAELARDAGKRVGILSSAPVNHATPAAFYAKVPSRGAYYQIGLQAFASGFEVLGAGLLGARQAQGKTGAGSDLRELAENAGYKTVRPRAELNALEPGVSRVFIDPDRFYPEPGGSYTRKFDSERDITLAQMTGQALKLLDSDAGFFLMVEGAAIDWACHGNNVTGMLIETLAFDEAVAVAKAFTEANPETLLVITSDHETGGLTMGEEYKPQMADRLLKSGEPGRTTIHDLITSQFDSGKESDPASWEEASSYFSDVLGVKNDESLAMLRSEYNEIAGTEGLEKSYAIRKLARKIVKLTEITAGITWTTGGHTDTPVPLYAMGPGSDRFEGLQENIMVAHHGIALLIPSSSSVPAKKK